MGVSLFMQISNKKKFCLKLALFLLILIVVDSLAGALFDLLRAHAKGGTTYNDFIVSEKCNADILVLGSSRARHHYNPSILDSIGGFAYNGGSDGIGIVLGLGRYLMCAEQHIPKVVVYDVTPEFDYLVYKDQNSKYLGELRPHYEKKGVKPIFDKFESPFQQLKMFSKMYRNNSKILANITDAVAKRPNIRGYYPQYGSLSNKKNAKDKSLVYVVDSVKMSLMEQLIDETKRNGSKLYFAISPKYFRNKLEKILPYYDPLIELAKKKNVVVLDYLFTPNLSNNSKMFVDAVHMNHLGAEAYSQMVVKRICKDVDTD